MSTVQENSQQLNNKRQLFFYVMFWASLFISMYFAFTSARHTVTEVYSDTVLHAFAFIYLTIALSLSYFRRSPPIQPATWMLLYAVFIECVQYFLPRRVFEFGDIGIDIIGILAGLFLYRYLIMRFIDWLDG